MTQNPDSDDPPVKSSSFMDSLKGIKKLKHDRVDLYHNRPRKNAQVHDGTVDDDSRYMPAEPSHSDQQMAESWFDHGLQKSLRRKIKMGQLPIEVTLDLHGYRRHEAEKELSRFMREALSIQARMVLIIHGKGYRSKAHSVIRPLVQNWLHTQTQVLAYCPAQPVDGGKGASYVYLKNTAHSSP